MTARGFTLVALTVAACSVSLADPAGRACDDAHACAGGRVCSAGVCLTPSGVVPGSGDGGAPVEGGVESDGGGGSTNLHRDGTFESGCGNWVPQNSSLSASSIAHGGVGSCQFCSTSGTDFTLDDKGFLTNPPPGLYRMRAWVRVAPGHPATSYGALLRSVRRPSGPNFQEVEKDGENLPFVDDWSVAQVDLEVTQPADVLNVVVYGGAPSCLLVDDVTVEKIR